MSIRKVPNVVPEGFELLPTPNAWIKDPNKSFACRAFNVGQAEIIIAENLSFELFSFYMRQPPKFRPTDIYIWFRQPPCKHGGNVSKVVDWDQEDEAKTESRYSVHASNLAILTPIKKRSVSGPEYPQ